MPRWLGWILIFGLVGCQSKSPAPLEQAAAPEAPPAIAEAMKFLEQGQVAHGLEVLTSAIEKSPNDCRLYSLRATLRHRAGLNREALDDLNHALAAAPHDAQLHNNRGFILLSLLQFDDAVRDLDRALELKPGMASACNNRGLIELARSNAAAAIQWFSQALVTDPDYVDALNNRGFAWMQTGRLENAFADLNQALRIQPKYVNALHNRGLVKAKAGELESAVLDFTEAMMIDPINPRYYEHRSQVYTQLGQTGEAAADLKMLDWLLKLQEFDRAIAAEPRNAVAWSNRARHFWDRGDEPRAQADLQRALELDAKCGTALVLQGRLALATKRFEEALKICEAALETEAAAAAASVRGDAYLALGQYDAALASFALAKRFDESVAEAYYRKSEELTNQGEIEQAKAQLDFALELDPTAEQRLR
jgi:tetratricopeptide (TPR) repeat protein